MTSRGGWWRLQVFLLVACALCPQFSSGLSPGAALEYAVKAAYLFKFTRFIEWPATAFASPDSPFNICILGNNPFGESIQQDVNGETVAGRRVAVQRLDHLPAPGVCQILYAGNPEERIRALGEIPKGVLTIGEGAAFARAGGMIGFLVENRRVTFDINWKVAEANGLKLNSGLLTVARTVIRQ